jgi:hypothetical protein
MAFDCPRSDFPFEKKRGFLSQMILCMKCYRKTGISYNELCYSCYKRIKRIPVHKTLEENRLVHD